MSCAHRHRPPHYGSRTGFRLRMARGGRRGGGYKPELLHVGRREAGVRRSVQDLAERVEARAVAGAIPRLFAVIPVDDAAEMRADGRAFVQRAVGIAVDGHLLETVPHDAAGSRLELI